MPDYSPVLRESEAGDDRVAQGRWSQQMATTDSTHTAGLWQRVDVPFEGTLSARVKKWRLRPPSAEYAYWWIARKLADLANLRLVLVARLNGLPEAETRTRIDDGLL